MEAGWDIGRRVGVQGSHRALMPGIHRREEFGDFGSAALSDDQPIGSHTQRLSDQLPRFDGAGPFNIGFPGAQVDHMWVVNT